MTGTIAIVFGFGAQKESIETLILSDGINLLGSSGEHFVDIALVGNIEKELVYWRFKNVMQGDR